MRRRRRRWRRRRSRRGEGDGGGGKEKGTMAHRSMDLDFPFEEIVVYERNIDNERGKSGLDILILLSETLKSGICHL